MNLEERYNRSKEWYCDKYGPDSWQWNDEGRYYAIGDYISSFGELSKSDWKFVEKEGIVGETKEILKDTLDNGDWF